MTPTFTSRQLTLRPDPRQAGRELHPAGRERPQELGESSLVKYEFAPQFSHWLPVGHPNGDPGLLKRSIIEGRISNKHYVRMYFEQPAQDPGGPPLVGDSRVDVSVSRVSVVVNLEPRGRKSSQSPHHLAAELWDPRPVDRHPQKLARWAPLQLREGAQPFASSRHFDGARETQRATRRDAPSVRKPHVQSRHTGPSGSEPASGVHEVEVFGRHDAYRDHLRYHPEG